MRAPSRAFQKTLAMVRKSAADVVAYSDAILFGVASVRNNSLPLIEASLHILRERVDLALEALAREGQP